MFQIELWHVDKRLVQGQEKAPKNRPTQWGEEQQLAADWLKIIHRTCIVQYTDRSLLRPFAAPPTLIRLLQQRDLQRMIAALCKCHQYQYFDRHSEVAKRFAQHFCSGVNLSA